MPFFSIITVTLNEETRIRKTLESVIDQTFGDFEVIVKDGGSTDNTIGEILRDERIRIVVKEDDGIYDGMNDAILMSKGEYLLFLNSGDCLFDNSVLQGVYDSICHQKNGDIIYGNYFNKGVFCRQRAVVSPFYLFRTPLNHQSMFFKKELFERLGLYNTCFRIYADYEFTTRVFFKNGVFLFVNITICDYCGGGISESKQGISIAMEENKIIKNTYYSKLERFFFGFFLFLSLRWLRIKLASSKIEIIRNTYQKLVNFVNK